MLMGTLTSSNTMLLVVVAVPGTYLDLHCP